MIDTICLRIHDLERNAQLVKFLHKRGLRGSERRVKHLESGLDLEREMRFREYTINHATGETYAKSYRSKVKSYNSDMALCIDFDRDFMEIEFSIPKYLFGDNVSQFGVEGLKLDRSREWNDTVVIDLMFARFVEFFRYWWSKEFGEIPLLRDTVEVRRLDLCFNYVFKSESLLKTYLAFVRQIRKKYQRGESHQTSYGPSSVYYPSKFATFKIYHKGPELRAHAGVARGARYWNDLLELADRTLRFEMGFRPSAMKELDLRLRPSVRKYLLAWRAWKREGKFVFEGKRYGIGTTGREAIVKRGKAYDRNYEFYLSASRDNDFEYGRATFDRRLFREMVLYFWKTSSRFMLNGVSRLNVAADRVEMYDGPDKVVTDLKGVSATRVKMLEALLRDRSWDEIERQGIMSKRQLYRYKALFRRLGFGEMNTTRGALTDLDHSFRTYWDEIRAIHRQNVGF